MLIYFVRHGQTDDNKAGIIQGHKDTPLNAHGRAQSLRLAQHLAGANVRFTAAFTSELSRAAETARILLKKGGNEGVPLKVHPGLKEVCMGSLEGKRRDKDTRAPTDCEPREEFKARVTQCFASILATQHILPSQVGEPTYLVVSHGAWITELLGVLLRQLPHFKLAEGVDLKKSCGNTSVMRVRCTFEPFVKPEPEPEPVGTRTTQKKEAGTEEKKIGNGGEGTHAKLERGKCRDGEREAIRRGRWTGEVLGWGEVEHLQRGERKEEERKQVVDDVRAEADNEQAKGVYGEW